MQIQCQHCGETCETESDLQEGQHVLCPFCGQKFSYQSKTATASEESTVNLIMAVCPYCGFGEQVDVQYAGQVGTCSKCGKDFTIMPNARGIPYEAPKAKVVAPSSNNSDSVVGFLLGLILGILGLLLAVLIDKNRYLKPALMGLVLNIIIGVILVAGFTKAGMDIHRKVSGAAECLTSEKADDTYDENKIKHLGENY